MNFKEFKKGVDNMAEKLRREKDIIKRTVSGYLEATTKDYIKYLEGSPSYITYYQLDDIATKQDGSLENVHSLTGKNTPNKYKKIEDVVVYGVDAMDISNEISEKGLQSVITGEFILLPDSIKPYPGDFFVYDYDGLRDHMFRIENVQFDRASPKKYFRCAYAIYPENPDLILTNLVKDENGKDQTYVMDYDNIGGQDNAIVKKADAVVGENAKLLVDSLISKYTNLFYDEDMDSFVFKTEKIPFAIDDSKQIVNLWSPYLQKFMHDTKLMTGYKKEILTEFYINDIDERSNLFFTDLGYMKSIFRKVETQDKELIFENSFMGIIEYNLRETRNLQFFHTADDYRVAHIYNNNSFYPQAFHILEQKYHQKFESLPNSHKFVNESDIPEDIQNGDILYRISPTNEYIPIDVVKVFDDEHILPITFNFLMKTEKELEDYLEGLEDEEIDSIKEILNNYLNNSQFLFGLIKSYLLGNLTIDENLLKKLNNYYYDVSFKNYILMPIVIYILKRKISSVTE
jgi:hypothetical protein